MIGGLDVGTTGAKLVVYDEKGKLQDQVYCEYPDKGGAHEVDAEMIWQTVRELLQKAGGALEAIGVTSFGETFAVLDEDDKVLLPSMLYTDPRGDKECAELVEKLGEERLTLATGTMPHSMYSLPKLMWIKNNLPDVYAKIARVLLIEDFIVYRLTGVAQIDVSLAARTMALSVRTHEWDDEIFAAAGIDKNLFSRVAPTGSVAGKVRSSLAEELGLSKELTVVNGCHDQIAAMTAAGVTGTEIAMCGLGTVACLPVVLDELPEDMEIYRCGYSFVPYISGGYACYILSFVGGSALQWFRREFGNGDSYAALDKEISPDPTGILIQPHFSGAATPFMNSSATASMRGFTFAHTRYDLYKALMEGVAMELQLNLEVLRKSGVAPKSIRATGGGARSDAWLQILADVTGIPITSLQCDEVGAAGTALMTGVAVGVYSGLSDVSSMVQERAVFTPDAGRNAIYTELMTDYRKMYQA